MNIIKKIINFNIIYFLIFFVFLTVSSFHIYHTYKERKEIIRQQALSLAQAATAFLPADSIKSLDLNSSDIKKPEYQELKRALTLFENSNKNVAAAYLYTQINENIYFIADSKDAEPGAYMSLVKSQSEDTDIFLKPFIENKSIIAGPVKNRDESYMRIFMPVTDPATQKVIAVFGYDFSMAMWGRSITRYVVSGAGSVIIIFLLSTFLYFVILKNRTLSLKDKNLGLNESILATLWEHAPVGIAVVSDFNFIDGVNKELEKILRRPKKDVIFLNWKDVTHPEDLEKDLKLFKRFKAGEIKNYRMEKRFLRPDGSSVWVDMIIAGLEETGKNHLCIMTDISKKVETFGTLKECERSKSLLLSHLPGIAYRRSYEKDWTMQFISEGCLKLTGYSPRDLIGNKASSFNRLIAPEYTRLVWKKIERAVALKSHFQIEYEIITASGERKWVWEIGQGVYGSGGEVKALEGTIIDINESKKQQMEIKFLDKHDALTGLYHRKYYEDAKARLDKKINLPITIIILDINGLRFVNDALGYNEGDYIIKETGKILKTCLRKRDLVARIGGDEFAVILAKTDRERASRLLHKIEDRINKYNARLKEKMRHISAAIGYGTKITANESLKDAEKEAEEYVNKRKLLEIKSYHHTILTSIMDSTYARSYETEQHAKRLAHISKLIGEKMDLPQESLDELELFSMLHDIGKVAVDDKILNKPDRLTTEEWEIIKKHSETGYRIAAASPELESISRYILYHHEHWDGSGYPHGLKGEEIPLLSRILAFADAYDAMTAGRNYRKALTKCEALAEIKKNVGKQFDPAIYKIFEEVLRESYPVI